ncbi:enoyl-CoA hydratase-related protein [Nocardioides sp. CPCC 206347]|uniref:enoyl-CoA hydratase-related protein n=1 Tax=unclassified Nocardioides TaxID=2615069 RepID=UPI00361B77FD
MPDPEMQIVVDVDGPVRRIRLHRPERLNAVTPEMLVALLEAIRASSRDLTVRVMTLEGSGRAFCAGGDLTAPGQPSEGTVALVNEVVVALREAPYPVVALVHGIAAGAGVSLVLACDVVMMGSTAALALGFSSIGLMPDGGATATLAAAVGRARALGLAVLGDTLSAAQAHDWGIASRVFDDDEFDARADEVVQRLAQGPTAAFAQTKKAVDAATLGDLRAHLARERAAQTELIATADGVAGVRAFVERLQPTFKGS